MKKIRMLLMDGTNRAEPIPFAEADDGFMNLPAAPVR
ncbi:hypothetical protein GGE16_005562 [Rhizobium leguminosarum]|uniref:Uncharacterized protein n=1 Tax=Rhizobium leguminosarum TaxID=384 RepID=A0AAE2MQE6_RHILE|nr:hypothetical protein [Rhizobium leguminosarum]MBB4435751.1 hypothetical protein [Rhizobium esperanzae]MBB4300326.1 hypothetical protein [Rhizobium leguminosarum]MBB4311597.1 hypothetical protein [Rhizobium leguminosarum]MBB4420412.1 hypothetical protein [Rhizobium leguminosarum]